MNRPLVIGPEQLAGLNELRERASAAPVDARALIARIDTPEGKAAHRAQMTAQSIGLPIGFLVTFSIEHGHPIGPCRHMSMSVEDKDRVPHPAAVWAVAELLGFAGGLHACKTWPELLQGHGLAINVVQPLAVGTEGNA